MKRNQVRIIGGKWRSRKLNFADEPQLRPTPDQVRETLFNWLAPYIQGAHCLDMFAGSGALGFEALSRGAASVLMMDQSPMVIQNLKKNAALLQAEDQITFFCGKAFSQNIPIGGTYDIIFLDPPFCKGYLPLCFEWIQKTQCLAQNALIYVEAERALELQSILPKEWQIIREKKAGQVGYYLVSI